MRKWKITPLRVMAVLALLSVLGAAAVIRQVLAQSTNELFSTRADVTIPNLVGRSETEAAAEMEHAGLTVVLEYRKEAIKDAGITRLPDLAALKVEYRELDKQKARLYEQYGEVKRELKEYGIIKQNVDSILRVTPGKEQAQEL